MAPFRNKYPKEALKYGTPEPSLYHSAEEGFLLREPKDLRFHKGKDALELH